MKISVVVPVFNSAQILNKLINKIKITLSEFKFEVILVNDSSTDSSWEVIEDLSKNKFIKGINLDQNYGQHNALIAGLNYATGDFFILIDDDLQHNPNDIIKIINKLNAGYDLCYTNYLNRKHPKDKIFFSKLSNLISSLIINKPFKLYLSSFKGFNKDLKNQIIKIKKRNIYLDVHLIKYAKKITTVDILHQKRLLGKTNYSYFKLIKLWCSLIENIDTFDLKLSSIFVFPFKGLIFFINTICNLFYARRKQFGISNKTFKNPLHNKKN